MKENGKIQIKVCPMFINRESQLANVDDVFNGIMVRGDATGDVVFYGKGAGKLPTASAVVADVIDCVKHLKARKYLFWEDAKPDYVEDFSENTAEAYVRAKGASSEAAMDAAERIFGTVTRLSRKNAEEGEVAFVTSLISEKELEQKLNKLAEDGIKTINMIRLADY